MPRMQYSVEQMLALQQSPHIKRPDNLPRIEQWIEQPAEKVQARPRTQNGKAEDGETSSKRPSPFERQSSRQQQQGEDIFLGPKTSFATASAARQTGRFGNGDEKPTTADDGRPRFERFGGRDKHMKENDTRDRESDKQKRFGGRMNQDDDATIDTRSRRGGDLNDRHKEQKDGGVSLDSNRRSGPPRNARLDQPWFRESHKGEAKVNNGDTERNGDSRWRDHDRGKGASKDEPRTSGEPKWMQDSEPSNVAHTQDDFAKWKESMKASGPGADQKPLEVDTNPFMSSGPMSGLTSEPSAKENDSKPKIPEGGVFGMFGGAKREGEAATPKATSKPKSSRFAGFFTREQEPVSTPAPAPELQQPAPEPRSPVEAPKQQLPASNEDQEGFNKMMHMLRMGGANSSQPPQHSSFARPPPSPPSQSNVRGADMESEQQSRPRPSRSPPMDYYARDVSSAAHQRRGPPSQQQQRPPSPPMRMPQAQQQQQQARPEPSGGRDQERDFLLKLMQQPRASPAFNEGQIYGQNYHSKNSSSEINSLLNSFASRPSETKARGPPPGFPPMANDNAYRSNNNMAQGGMAGERLPPPPPPPQQQQRYDVEDQHRPPMSPPDHASMLNRGPPSPKSYDIRPPPGFGNGRQGPQQSYPPGLASYSSQSNQQAPPQMMPQPQHSMRNQGPPPPQQGGYGPPMQGPPPGFHQQHSQQQQPQRRRPSAPMGMGVPPGYEGYGDMARRGPPMGYPQYLDNRGGGY